MRKLSTQELNRLNTEVYKTSEGMPAVVVLDNVRSGHNAGSVFRTCDAFGIQTIYLCGITPCPPNREVMKTALGSTESVNWEHFADTKVILEKLKQQGNQIVFAEHTTESIPLQTFMPDSEQRYVFVFGNEVEGIRNDLLSLADQIIEIPQFGTKHSFNVSVAAGIILWHVWNTLQAP